MRMKTITFPVKRNYLIDSSAPLFLFFNIQREKETKVCNLSNDCYVHCWGNINLPVAVSFSMTQLITSTYRLSSENKTSILHAFRERFWPIKILLQDHVRGLEFETRDQKAAAVSRQLNRWTCVKENVESLLDYYYTS